MTAPPAPARLSPEVARAVEAAGAETLSYAVRVFASPEEPPRLVVALGEAHVKLARASELGRAVVERFDLRGVETFQRRRVALGGLLGVLIHAPRSALRAVTFGKVKDSTIVDARARREGHTIELEQTDVVPMALHAASIYLALFFVVAWTELALMLLRVVLDAQVLADAAAGLTGVALAFELHLLLLVPAWLSRRHSWAWLVHPAVALVTVRDTLMAEGTARMMRDYPAPPAALVIMGRAHLAGYEHELVARGYRRVP